ncbi:allophanate hydrolase [Halarcobacter sp.]|uniref:allophanate hydrolase n=1 Tax=Halarcobacter sp. TaxID=2321133 RepID=UPI0029F57359|nr:allophanate hydrolase [Halarcobacter sp.]
MLEKQLFDIQSIHDAYKGGTKVEDIVKEVYRRIEEVNDDGIFIHLQPIEDILKEVSSFDNMNLTDKPLWGIPFTVKDNIDVAGVPTTAACEAYEYTPVEDAFVVKLLKEAGAICIGKTNLDQFATGLVGVRTPYGAPKNAVDASIVPGGSSCGSAVAVSHQIVSFSLGTDTAGSGRVPAALNNIVGFKPTLGTLSKQGVVPACLTLDTISIFALTICDASQIFDISAQYNIKDPYSKKRELEEPKKTEDMIIGVPNSASRIFYGDDLEEESYERTLIELREKGFTLKEIDLEAFFEVGELLYEGSWVAERYTVIGDLIEKAPQKVLDVTRNIISKAKNFSSSDVYRDIYKLNELKREVEIALEGIDLLALPTITRPYTVEDLENEPIEANSRIGLYTKFVNLLDFSAIAIPVERRKDGFASGITAMAVAHKEDTLSLFCRTLQEGMKLYYGNSKVEIDTSTSDCNKDKKERIEIAVVGAHLKNMPLNYQLTDLDASYVYRTRTAKKYKLYNLVNEDIAKPGLIKTDDGYAIEIEVWSLPIKNLGAFEKNISTPLCIGDIELENGKYVKGFLCEHIATLEAEDISAFGGWKAYLNSIEK